MNDKNAEELDAKINCLKNYITEVEYENKRLLEENRLVGEQIEQRVDLERGVLKLIRIIGQGSVNLR